MKSCVSAVTLNYISLVLPTGFRTLHFVSFLYVFFFSFLFLLFRFFSHYFVFVFFFAFRFFFFRFFSLLFSLFSFRFFSFRFFSFFFRFSVYRYPDKINFAKLNIGLKFANLGQNIQILFENREKLENICSIYMWGENGVKLCTGVLHNLTKYINYYVGFNMSQIIFRGKIFKFHAKIAKMDSIVVYDIHICSCISVKFCTVLVHKFPKDIIYDIKLKRSRISNFEANNCYNAKQ